MLTHVAVGSDSLEVDMPDAVRVVLPAQAVLVVILVVLLWCDHRVVSKETPCCAHQKHPSRLGVVITVLIVSR